MKASLVITDDIKQVVLTPETKTDKTILEAIKGKDISIHVGSFWDGSMYGERYKSSTLQECQGGWVREFESKDSVILVIKDTKRES